MKILNFTFCVFMTLTLFLFGCKDKTEPEFYYIENNSDENIIVYNSAGIGIEIEAKSNIKVDTTKEFQYSLKRNKTIVEFKDLSESKNINADIYYITSNLEEGFVNGHYCYILKFKNSFSANSEYIYTFYNTREQSVTISYSVFGITNTITVEKNTEIECCFKYKLPELQYYIDGHKISPNYSNKENGRNIITM